MITNFGDIYTLLTDRRTTAHADNTEYYLGNHWLDGRGFIGELPPLSHPGYSALKLAVQNGFVSENAVKDVTDSHVDGALSREPLWRFLPKQSEELTDQVERTLKEVEDALTEFWNDRELLLLLQKALTTALLEERAVIRPFVLARAADKAGNVTKQKSLADALKLLRFEVVTSDKGGVFTDAETLENFGVYAYEDADNVKKAEITWVDASGQTRLRVVNDKDISAILDQLPTLAKYINAPESQTTTTENPPLNLGGRLFLYELQREALITEQIRSLQKSLNLTWTMKMRNINLAGSRERYFLNAQRPKRTRRVPDESEPSGYREVVEDEPLKVGAGTAAFLGGFPIYDDTGTKITGYTDPNVSVSDPVDVTTFVNSRKGFYEAILSQAHQLHKAIAGDATASGKSRVEARAEFEKSLMRTKTILDASGRWLLEVALRFAANLCQRKELLELRCDFNSIVDAGSPDDTEREQNRKDYEVGAMSRETFQSLSGIDDTAAETLKIETDVNYQLNLQKKRLEIIALDTSGILTIDEKVKLLGIEDESERKAYITQLEKEKAASAPAPKPMPANGNGAVV